MNCLQTSLPDYRNQGITEELARQTCLEMCHNRPDIFTAHYLKDSLPLRMPEFHVEIYQDIADRSLERIVRVAPTGFGKTSVVGHAIPTWMLCYQHYNDILYISGTYEFACERLRKVKNEIEYNEKIRNDFEIGPGAIWRDDEIITSGDVRMLARGKGGQIQGRRPEIIIADDLEDEQEVRSELQRQHLWEWWNVIVLNRLAPGGRLFLIGSLISKLSFINKFTTPVMRDQGWNCRVYKAQEAGQSTWKERWSNEAIENRKRELVGMPGVFEALYQADVSKIQKYTFQMDWIRYYDNLPADRFPLYCYIDPAVGVEVHHDYTAIVVGGMDLAGNFYVVDFIKKRFNIETLELFDVLLALYDRYQLKGIGIETNGFQKFLKVFFDMKCRALNKYPNIIEVKHDSTQSKEARISALAPMFQAGKILIKRDMYGLLSEYEGYPEVETDDGLDALAGLKDIVVPGQLNPVTGVQRRYQPRNQHINF